MPVLIWLFIVGSEGMILLNINKVKFCAMGNAYFGSKNLKDAGINLHPFLRISVG